MAVSRMLLVQCCHPAQFFYVAERVRERHPEWELEALVTPDSGLQHGYALFPHFRAIHVLGRRPLEVSRLDGVLFPLLNRGYWNIKREAASLAPPHFEVDYQGTLLPLGRTRLTCSLFQTPRAPSPDFVPYQAKFPLPSLGNQILILESCHPSLAQKAQPRLQSLIPSGAGTRRITSGSLTEIYRQVRREPWDSAVLFLSGEKGYSGLKWLPFLLRIRRILIIDEGGHPFYAGWRSMGRLLLGRILHGVAAPVPQPRILMVQTDTPRYMLGALEKLKQPSAFPRSEVILLCRKEDHHHFRSRPELKQIITYSAGELRSNLALLKQIHALDADLVSAVFSGRPAFRKAKLLFLLLPIRPHLVFNAALDSYPLTVRTFRRLFRRETLLFDRVTAESGQRVLFLQTEHREMLARAVCVLQDPKVAPAARIIVWCHESVRDYFEALPEVEQVHTYNPGRPLTSLRQLWKLAGSRFDMVAALFTERPIYRKQKLLFFLFPARAHLVFNAHLDCFYLGWRTMAWLLTSELEAGRMLARKLVRLLFFVPRFAYLLVWAGLLKLKRATLEEPIPEDPTGPADRGKSGSA